MLTFGRRVRLLLCTYSAFVAVLLVMITSSQAEAGSTLVFESDDVVVYSGPSFKFRPLGKSKKGRNFSVSNQIVSGADGDFYQIIIGGDEDDSEKRLGYVSVNENVKFNRSEEDQEDFTQYAPLALAESAVQIDMSLLRDTSFFWQLGYQKYPGPGLYLKGYIGQVLLKTSSNTTFGGEIGFDQLFKGRTSFYTSFAMGPLFVASEDNLFIGSSALGLHAFARAGVRYNLDQHASFSLGLGQFAAFNSTNSFLSSALSLTLEVGL